MPRRDAQVHKMLSRLMRNAGRSTPPIWYPAMLAYPPTLPPPLKPQHEKRRAYDLPPDVRPSHLLDKRPLDIVYPEDQLRQQFFKDHPFEAFRAKSLVEMQEVREEPLTGPMWDKLVQRGRNPSPEDCIAFALNLHREKGIPLSDAYRTAVHQYRALRAEHTIMLSFACNEADAYGAEFASYELTRLEKLEEAELQKWREELARTEERIRRSKKWRMDPVLPPEKWTQGEGYMRRLREGGGPRTWQELDLDLAGGLEVSTTQVDSMDTWKVDARKSRQEVDELNGPLRPAPRDPHAPSF
ncbi:hypothetical protein CALCODRAFT_500727 [Calocera cornea HHB12733]|uniref:Small ribosomal subunit protein mS23 n=1 Tax=Calocera cornea HHB12733 TaxID=1353952 RepID=A0A165DY48_9BASI|nr:hypothetical protein CALCODRAFT_500727 [Calocera cornea HHB12733]